MAREEGERTRRRKKKKVGFHEPQKLECRCSVASERWCVLVLARSTLFGKRVERGGKGRELYRVSTTFGRTSLRCPRRKQAGHRPHEHTRSSVTLQDENDDASSEKEREREVEQKIKEREGQRKRGRTRRKVSSRNVLQNRATFSSLLFPFFFVFPNAFLPDTAGVCPEPLLDHIFHFSFFLRARWPPLVHRDK